jgi:hypothetical protein
VEKILTSIYRMDLITWLIRLFERVEKTKKSYDPNDLVVYEDETPMKEKIYELTQKRVKFVEV